MVAMLKRPEVGVFAATVCGGICLMCPFYAKIGVGGCLLDPNEQTHPYHKCPKAREYQSIHTEVQA